MLLKSQLLIFALICCSLWVFRGAEAAGRQVYLERFKETGTNDDELMQYAPKITGTKHEIKSKKLRKQEPSKIPTQKVAEEIQLISSEVDDKKEPEIAKLTDAAPSKRRVARSFPELFARQRIKGKVKLPKSRRG